MRVIQSPLSRMRPKWERERGASEFETFSETYVRVKICMVCVCVCVCVLYVYVCMYVNVPTMFIGDTTYQFAFFVLS